MKIQELYQSGVTDNEGLGDHARASVAVQFQVNFAHELGLEELFSKMMINDHFQAALEAEFAASFHRTIQKMVRTANIQPGDGWTDDFEVSVDVTPKETSTL